MSQLNLSDQQVGEDLFFNSVLNRKFDNIKIYLLRLTPMYMIILMIYTCLTTYIGDGPMWPKQIESAENCRESWWTNLLYVNNLVLVDKQVNTESWITNFKMTFETALEL